MLCIINNLSSCMMSAFITLPWTFHHVSEDAEATLVCWHMRRDFIVTIFDYMHLCQFKSVRYIDIRHSHIHTQRETCSWARNSKDWNSLVALTWIYVKLNHFIDRQAIFILFSIGLFICVSCNQMEITWHYLSAWLFIFFSQLFTASMTIQRNSHFPFDAFSLQNVKYITIFLFFFAFTMKKKGKRFSFVYLCFVDI